MKLTAAEIVSNMTLMSLYLASVVYSYAPYSYDSGQNRQDLDDFVSAFDSVFFGLTGVNNICIDVRYE
jgi:hypothetical protein